jgi:hypothetical protein
MGLPGEPMRSPPSPPGDMADPIAQSLHGLRLPSYEYVTMAMARVVSRRMRPPAPARPRPRLPRGGAAPPPDVRILVEALEVLRRSPLLAQLAAFPQALLRRWLTVRAAKQRSILLAASGGEEGRAQALAIALCLGGLVRLFLHERAEVPAFSAAWGGLSTALPLVRRPLRRGLIGVLAAVHRSGPWAWRVRRCTDPRCGRFFVDRSRAWRLRPAQGCSRRHATLAARRRALPMSSPEQGSLPADTRRAPRRRRSSRS